MAAHLTIVQYLYLSLDHHFRTHVSHQKLPGPILFTQDFSYDLRFPILIHFPWANLLEDPIIELTKDLQFRVQF